ncbi:hypothetical protein SUDANB6_05673 [Streptomyces sp. enrichment culture]
MFLDGAGRRGPGAGAAALRSPPASGPGGRPVPTDLAERWEPYRSRTALLRVRAGPEARAGGEGARRLPRTRPLVRR